MSTCSSVAAISLFTALSGSEGTREPAIMGPVRPTRQALVTSNKAVMISSPGRQTINSIGEAGELTSINDSACPITP